MLHGIERWSKPEVPEELKKFMIDNLVSKKFYGQLQQDLLASYIADLSGITEGFFVEFGATNGIDLSNTYLLEETYLWKGILAEPGRSWKKALQKNRNCSLDFRCVWKTSGVQVEFLETKSQRELSTITTYSDTDGLASERIRNSRYSVLTISLLDLLRQYEAPEKITYLSIDTEGSEYEIISGFDFNKHKFLFISIEHNYTKNEILIDQLLKKEGYTRVLQSISEWDAWYVNSKHLETLKALRVLN